MVDHYVGPYTCYSFAKTNSPDDAEIWHTIWGALDILEEYFFVRPTIQGWDESICIALEEYSRGIDSGGSSQWRLPSCTIRCNVYGNNYGSLCDTSLDMGDVTSLGRCVGGQSRWRLLAYDSSRWQIASLDIRCHYNSYNTMAWTSSYRDARVADPVMDEWLVVSQKKWKDPLCVIHELMNQVRQI